MNVTNPPHQRSTIKITWH